MLAASKREFSESRPGRPDRSAPRPGSFRVRAANDAEDTAGEFGVFFNLPIEHTYQDEIGAAVEGIWEGGPGLEGAGSENFKGNPGLFDFGKDISDSLRIVAPGIVVGANLTGFVDTRGREIIVGVKGFLVKIGTEFLLFA